MATIPFINGDPETLDLSFGTDMVEEYAVSRINYGDRYSQRARKGMNSVAQSWRLMWTRISDDDAEKLRLFFRGLAGVGIIEWAPYGQDQTRPLKWTGTGWSAKPSGYLVQDCSITLTQEFDL